MCCASQLLVSVLLVSLSAGVAAVCSPENPPDTYNFYPGNGFYPSGTTQTYPWQTPVGNAYEGFETYADGSVIESSANKALQSHLEVTSGSLTSRYVSKSAYRRARTEDFNFRMLIQGLSGGKRIKWTDQSIRSRFYVDSWQATNNAWQGVHLFARYRTENDLYVASLRRDGTVYIKRKLCGTYTTIANGQLKDQAGQPLLFNTRQWYTLTFSAIDNRLSFYVNDVLQISVLDGTFSWGTMGIRTDYSNIYLDDLIVQ
jgi:hypothetical protein